MQSQLTTPRRKLARADKARIAFEHGHVHPAGRKNTYLVDGTKPGVQYRVEVGPNTYCSCPDWRHTYERTGETGSCYHCQSVFLYRAAIQAAFRPHREVAA